jgi:hypothetical protein
LFLHRAFIVPLLLASWSCGQGEGAPCELDDDCSSGLCCGAQGDMPPERDICIPCGTARDAGPPVSDSGPPPDSATPDASPGDAGDAAIPDAATPDAGGGGECTGSTSSCEDTEYCAAPACDDDGACTARPSDCPGVFAPVCGCDGNQYVNECEARASGVTVDPSGDACDPDAGT